MRAPPVCVCVCLVCVYCGGTGRNLGVCSCHNETSAFMTRRVNSLLLPDVYFGYLHTRVTHSGTVARNGAAIKINTDCKSDSCFLHCYPPTGKKKKRFFSFTFPTSTALFVFFFFAHTYCTCTRIQEPSAVAAAGAV